MISELASSQAEQVLVHQDLHGDNILAAERRPWLVIDPKPLLAEREFSLARSSAASNSATRGSRSLAASTGYPPS